MRSREFHYLNLRAIDYIAKETKKEGEQYCNPWWIAPGFAALEIDRERKRVEKVAIRRAKKQEGKR